MDKREFLKALEKGLSALPKEDREERLGFYSEMIDDRMEEGLSAEEAVEAIGDPGLLSRQIAAEFLSAAKRSKGKKLRGWEIVLLVLGSPIWLSLSIAALAVIFSLWVTLWSAGIALWAAFGSLVGGALGGLAAGGIFLCTGHPASGIAMVGAGLVCAGLSVFLFLGCKAVTKGCCVLTKKLPRWIGRCFGKKEERK